MVQNLHSYKDPCPCSVRKNAGGKSIHVVFGSNHSSEYHAPWLWYNDSRNSMVLSGQRHFSPGSWNIETFIVDAIIHHYSEMQNIITSHQIHDIETVNSINPLEKKYISDHEYLSEFLLVIHWNRPMIKLNDTTKVTQEDFVSVYNMFMLKQWSYDSVSTNESRLKREISEKHTFLYKYGQLQNRGVESNASVALINANRKDYGGLICVDYDHIVSGGVCDELITFFDSLFLEGAVMVTNAPPASNPDSDLDEAVSSVGKIISGGSLSHGSLYGDNFHVKATHNAINVAYTAIGLCPHQDLAYYESKPGFQLLHCIANCKRSNGGESLLIDCMAAAYHFRQLAPDLFEILVKCPATFVKVRDGASMMYHKPHIVLYHDGQSDLNNMDREIVSVNWSPPFQGRPHMHPDRVEDYFKAYAAFELMLDSSKCPMECSKASGISLDLALTLSEYAKKYTWIYHLKPGEIMVFNNTRMLHGRRRFVLGEPDDINTENNVERHLVGAYTNIDDSLNNYRLLLRQAGCTRKRVIPNVANGSISTSYPWGTNLMEY